MQSELTEEVAITRGVRQGDYLSPLLFSIVMDKIVSYVKHLLGYRIRNEEINIVFYADDMAHIHIVDQRMIYRDFFVTFISVV